MQRVVVKVGTGVVSLPDGRLALGRIGALVEQVGAVMDTGVQVVLVSSGAVGLGAARLGIGRVDIVDRQAAAAVGQGSLLGLYDELFRRHGRTVAQVLLTEADFHHRTHYLNLAAALERLLELGALPIVNENDVVSTVELALTGQVFGDNDRLAALVASSLGADLLVLLSDVDGVYTAPPGSPGAERLKTFDPATPIELGGTSAGGRGGMTSKIAAAQIASRSGVRTVIASGCVPGTLQQVVAGQDVGTTFVAQPGMNRRRQWIAFATVPKGTLEVNAGAREALLQRNASLLAPGLVRAEGTFDAGAVVRLCTDGVEFGRGIVGVASAAITPGSRGILVHRDDIALLELP